MFFKKTRTTTGHHAFTIKEDAILREIIVDCHVSLPYHPVHSKGTPPPKVFKVKALLDTGATNCCINQTIIDLLGLKPHDKAEVHHGGGVTTEDVFNINIILPNDLVIPFRNVTKCKLTTGKFDLIIGMDLLTLGDFAITNANNKTIVSFKIPSTHSIDFNDGETTILPPKKPEIKSEKKADKIDYSKTPANAKCPCGSDLKYKRCHGKRI